MACQHKSKLWENRWCKVACSYCTLMQESTCKHNKQTNADRIRAMSDEEFIDFFRYRGCPPDRLTGKCVKVGVCEACWVDWLKQTAEEVDDDKETG